MPIVKSDFKSSFTYHNGHLQTIIPALFRRISIQPYTRQRIETPDGDFLDLDWSRVESKNLVIISHGLEGSSQTPYALGMAKKMNENDWDVLVWNYRGCSGEINRLPHYYHSGYTEDLDLVIQFVTSLGYYENIVLIGFSVGGNITLKYLGEQKYAHTPIIKAAITFSVPCDLEAAAVHLSKFENFIYLRRFIKSLVQKIELKQSLYPSHFEYYKLKSIKNFEQFDDAFTAPMFGYPNAKAYWKANSSKYFLHNISIPTLLITAQNDPFFTSACWPIQEAKNNPNLFLETPLYGGHCGFGYGIFSNKYYSEARAVDFLEQLGIKN